MTKKNKKIFLQNVYCKNKIKNINDNKKIKKNIFKIYF